ncbi:MAG: LamG domain-containing protein, partial [Planctomycetota bacterium]
MFGQVHGPARVLLCLAACLVVTGTATAQGWWDAAWYERKKLPFKNADQAENLVDFPVLVVLDSTRIDYTKTLDAGEDLRFVDDDGSTVLSHEIEEWNESGTSYVWVKVPQVDGVSSSDHIWMYYDNTLASDAQDAAGVWSADYEGVWHLNTDPSLSQPGTITFDNVTTNTSSSARSSASFSHAVGTGDSPILVVVSTTRGDQGTSGVTYGGQALTLAVSADAGGSGREWVSIWYLVDPPTGSNTVAVTFNNSQDPTGIAAMSYFGVDQSAPIDVTANKTTGSSATVSLDITPTVANTMIVGGLGHHGGDTDPHTPGGGVTAERYDIVSGTNTGDDSSYAGGEIAATTVQTYTFEFTGARSDDFAIACVALKPAVAIVDSHEGLGPWWNDAWTERGMLTFDNSGQSENLVNFPVLVKLDSSRIDYAKTQNAGQDLRFIDADGTTVLAHEIEEWNESGTSWVWVEVPQIDASSSADFITMYYGNTGASDGQDERGVWDTDYLGVWHLNESPANGVAGHIDSAGPAVVPPVTLVDTNTAEGDASSLDITSHDVSGSDTLLIVCVALETSDPGKVVQSVTWDQGGSSESLTRFDSYLPSHGKLGMEVWYRLSPTAGTGKTVRVTLEGGNSQKWGATAMTFSDVPQTPNPLGNWQENSGIDSAPGPITVSNTTDRYVVDWAAYFESNNPSVGVDQTERSDIDVNGGAFRAFGSTQDGDDGGVMSWTIGGGSLENAHVGFTIDEKTSLDGTPENFAGSAGSTTDATGQISGADEFDGTNDHIDFPAMDFGDTFTLEAWIKPPSGTQYCIISNSVSGGSADGFKLFIPNSNSLSLETGNGSNGNAALTAVGLFSWDQWAHVAVQVDRASGSAAIYHNGADVTTDTTIRTDFQNTSNWRIGRFLVSGYEFDGSIDEPRVSSVVRSADWIKAQYLSMIDAFITFGGEPPGTSSDGTPAGAMTAGDLVTGQISGALDFDGTNDRIEMGDVIDMGTSDMTFSAWIKPTADGHIQAKAWANPYYGLRYTPGGDLRAMFHYGTGEVSLYSTALLNDGDFHYITAVWDRDGDMEIYVDGVSDGTLDISSHSAVDISNTNSWVIGSNCNAGCASSSNQFGGIIDEVRI